MIPTRKHTTIRRPLLAAVLILLTLATCQSCGKELPAVTGEPDKARAAGAVTLSEEKLRAAGIETSTVSLQNASIPLQATAAIELNGNLVSKIGSRVAGRVARILAIQGERVRAGQVLAYIDTVELDQTWAEYRKAKARQDLAVADLRREEILLEKKVTPEKDVLKARREVKEAEAEVVYAKDRLCLLGVDWTKLEEQRNGSTIRPLIPIVSPIAGAVIERTVTQGEMVNPDKTLFTVADLSTLWVLIDIYERDLVRIKVGTEARLSVAALPEKIFQGTISYLSDVLDEKTRTVKARVTVRNAHGLLRPGMFANVSLERTVPQKMVMIPEQAVLIEGNERYVFVQLSPNTFKRKSITVGSTHGGQVGITDGLREGEVIAVRGTFSLKSELAKGSLQAK